jgi:hypothetical protein
MKNITAFVAGMLTVLSLGALAAVSTRITYNQTASGGQHLSLAIHYATLALQEANRAQTIASAVTAGGVTQANLENSAEFGAATGQGATLYSAMITLQTDLQAIQTAQLLANLDQGN